MTWLLADRFAHPRSWMTRALVGLFAVVSLSSCWGTVGVVGEYDEGYPPEGYIATATPVYYEGFPSYWYGGRWYRREGAGWRAYHDEPAYLHNYRSRAAPVRQSYGRGQYYGHARGGGGGGHHR